MGHSHSHWSCGCDPGYQHLSLRHSLVLTCPRMHHSPGGSPRQTRSAWRVEMPVDPQFQAAPRTSDTHLWYLASLTHCRDFTHCLILSGLPLYDCSCFISKDAKTGTHGGEQVCHSSWPPSCCLWEQHAGPLSPRSLTGTDLGLGWWLRWAVRREKRVRHRVRTPALHLGPACMCSVAEG